MIKLYNGDMLVEMDKIADKSVDMILTDLPYGTTASMWDIIIPFDKLWKQYNRVIKDNGAIVLFASGFFTPQVLLSNIDMYKYKWVWEKNNVGNFVHARNRPLTKHEDILVFSKAPMGHKSQLNGKRMKYNPQGLVVLNKYIPSGESKFGTVAGKRDSHKEGVVRTHTNYPTDVLRGFPEVSAIEKQHTNQKPVELLEYLIKTYTNENDVVLDSTMGSGSTGVACKRTDRKFIGIELDEKYFEIAKERISKTQYIQERLEL